MIHERFPASTSSGAAPGATRLSIDCGADEVTIDRGTADEIEVRVDTNRPDQWQVSMVGDTVEVRRERLLLFRGGSGSVRVSVPDGTPIRVAVASADVTIRLDAGPVTVSTASGDVRVDAAASIDAKSSSGDVTVGRVVGDAKATSASGDIRIGDVGGELSATTASGEIRVGSTARGRAQTASGSIRVECLTGELLNANSMSGDITIGLPPGRRVDLDAKSVSGSIHVPSRRPGLPDPTVNVTIRASTVSGDVRLRRA